MQAFLGRLWDAAIALGLLAVGAALRLDGTAGAKFFFGWLMAVKLLVLPLIAATAYILAMRMGGDGKSVG